MEGEQGGRGGIIGRLASGSLKSLDERFPPAQYLSKYGEAICQDRGAEPFCLFATFGNGRNLFY